MKFKLFLTDREAMNYINSNYPGAIIKSGSVDRNSECEDFGDNVENYTWGGETPAMYVLDSDYNDVDKVAYLENSEPDAYRVIVGGVVHSFDSMYRARLFYGEALDAAEYEEELHNIRFVYKDYNPITGQIEWVEDYE